MKYASLRQGLVGAWCPSLGPSGNTLIDRSGYGNHGALTNMDAGTDWVASRYGWALDFDGINDFVDLGNKQHTAFTNSPMSVTAWVTARNLSGYKRVLHREVHFLFGTLDKEVLLALGSGTAWNSLKTFGSAITLVTNQLYFLAATYDGSRASGYINGQLIGTVTGAMVYNSTRNLELGSADLAISPQWWDGTIDDARIYNRELSHSEVRLLTTEPGIGLQPERTSVFFGAQLFNSAWARNSNQLISAGVI